MQRSSEQSYGAKQLLQRDRATPCAVETRMHNWVASSARCSMEFCCNATYPQFLSVVREKSLQRHASALEIGSRNETFCTSKKTKTTEENSLVIATFPPIKGATIHDA